MRKTELISQVAQATGLTQTDAAKAVNATLEAITTALKRGDKVTLIGFGTFAVRKTAARTGFNPSTRQKLKIPAGKRAAFKAGTALKAVVSGKGGTKRKVTKAGAKKKK